MIRGDLPYQNGVVGHDTSLPRQRRLQEKFAEHARFDTSAGQNQEKRPHTADYETGGYGIGAYVIERNGLPKGTVFGISLQNYCFL